MRQPRGGLVRSLWWMPLVMLGTVGAVLLEYGERYSPLVGVEPVVETLEGNVLVDIVEDAASGLPIITVLVDAGGEGELPDGIADRLYQLQTLKDAANVRGVRGYYNRMVAEYRPGTLELTKQQGDAEPVLAFMLGPDIGTVESRGDFIEGFGLSRRLVSGVEWRIDQGGLTAEQRAGLAACGSEPSEGVPDGCDSYGMTSCGLPGGSCPGTPSGCMLNCTTEEGDCCAWCADEGGGACCRCVSPQ